MISIVLAPRIPFGKIPDNEHIHADSIQWLLFSIGHRCEDFSAAIQLFDRCFAYVGETRRPSGNRLQNPEEFNLQGRWMHIAVREAAAIIYRFNEDMESIGKNLGHCPTLRALLDMKSKREATRAFSKQFPNWEGIRHSGQHWAKLYGTPEGLASHVIPGDRTILVNSLLDRRYETTFEGKKIGMELTQDTLAKLRHVRDLYWLAFIPAQE